MKEGDVCFLEQNSLALFLFLIYSLDFYTKRPQWPSKKKLRQHVKKIAEGNSIRSHSCLATHERLLSFYFVFFFFFTMSFSFDQNWLWLFPQSFKKYIFSEQKGGKITLDGSVDCRGLAHTLSLCATLCKRQRNPHTNDGLMCVSFLWVGGCV
jgi:hypothetical protein